MGITNFMSTLDKTSLLTDLQTSFKPTAKAHPTVSEVFHKCRICYQ